MCDYKDREFLIEEYVRKEKKLSEIASNFDISPQAVHYWIKKHGISRRDDRLESKEWMEEKYLDEELSTIEIGEIVDESHGKVHYWLQQHGIITRSISEAKSGTKFSKNHRKNLSESLKGVMEGDEHPQWEGGYDDYYGINWEEQKKKALKRDEECVHCGATKDLIVHHIVYMRLFKKWDTPKEEDANILSNLATLCRSCHSVLHNHPHGESIISTEVKQ